MTRGSFTGAAGMLACGRSAAVTAVLAWGCSTAVACCGLEHNRYIASTGLLDKDPNTAVADMLGRSTTAVASLLTCNCSTAAASILNPGRYTAMTSMLAGGRPLAAMLAGGRPLAAVLAGGRPLAAVLAGGRPLAAVLAGGRPLAAVQDGGRPLTAVLDGGRPLAAVPAGGHSTAAAGIQGRDRYTAAGGGHCTAVVNMLAEDRCTSLAGVRRPPYITAANLLARGRRRPVAMTTSGVVRVEMAAGGRALVPNAAKLVNMHGVGAGPQPQQEAGHKEAGGGLQEEEGAGDVEVAGDHFHQGALVGGWEAELGGGRVRPHIVLAVGTTDQEQ
jgi:hypothetical protein